jgi:phage repressor protein C with HTH and peptisase S24 domain
VYSQGEILKHQIKLHGFTQADFADKIGVTRGYIQQLVSKVHLTDDVIERMCTVLEIKKDVFDVPKNLVAEESVQYIKKQQGVPYYDVDAAASNVETFDDKPETVTAYITIPSFQDCNFYVNIFGHSMYPKYCSGEIIACKKIEHHSYLPFGEAFLIKLKDGNRYVKYIRKGSDKSSWLLVSENEKYDPFEVHIDMVDSVYIIKGKITKNMI